MRNMFPADVTVDVAKADQVSWQSILSMPKVKSKLVEHNDDGTGMIYVQCKDEDGKIVTFNHPHMKFSELKKFLRKESIENEYMMFVTFDSFRYKIMKPMTTPIKMNRFFVADMGGKRYFMGDDLRSGEFEEAHVARECLCLNAVVDGEMQEIIFPLGNMSEEQILRDLSEDNIVKICGMEVPEVVKKKVFGRTVVELKYSLIVNEYTFTKETYPDVAAIVPVLKSYDDYALFRDSGTDTPLYPLDVNVLLTFSVMYMRPGEPPFNIILGGVGGSAKTSAASFLSKVYSNDGTIISANMGTAKGLVPSYGDKPSPGLLIEPRNFVKVVDEFFRRSEKEALSKGIKDPTSFVYSFLTEAMNVVERRADVLAGSGKGALPPGTVMKDSFLATDNLNPSVRVALATAVSQDKAVMRRFTFLQLNEVEAAGVRNATTNPSVDEVFPFMDELAKAKGYSLALMKRYSRWFRREVLFVRFERQWCKKMTEALVAELIADAAQISENTDIVAKWVAELNVIPYMEAFVRCCALSQAVFHEKKSVLPTHVDAMLSDYVEAERLFRRLFKDTFEVYSQGLIASAKSDSQGIDRTMGGFV